MADEEDGGEGEEGGGGSKLIIIIVVAVVVLAGGGGAAFFLLSGDDSAGGGEEVAQEAAAPSEESQEAYYVSMPKAFVFNVPGEQRDRLVQIKVQLLVRGPENQSLATENTTQVEGLLLDAFRASTAEELASVNGQERVREEALQAVRAKLEEITGKPVVERILFTGFVMQ